jgi:hypothetical protein
MPEHVDVTMDGMPGDFAVNRKLKRGFTVDDRRLDVWCPLLDVKTANPIPMEVVTRNSFWHFFHERAYPEFATCG